MKAVLGLDLHGTLLDGSESFPKKNCKDFCLLLDKLSEKLLPMSCTGNDLSFVRKVLPNELLRRLEGFVLETGCTYTSSSDEREHLLISERSRRRRDSLEQIIRAKGFDEIRRFGRRLATISLFCENPRSFFEVVEPLVRDLGYSEDFFVTYSSVAVDIVPRGFDKLFGLKKAAMGRELIAIADSMNDLALLEGADYSFAPANLAPEAEQALLSRGRAVLPLRDCRDLKGGVVYKAMSKEIEGVLEIMKLFDEILH